MVADPSQETIELARLQGAGKFHEAEVHYGLSSKELTGLPPRIRASEEGSPQQSASSDKSSVAQGADLLDAMLTLWRRVLDVPTIRADDDFFWLGGHSMAAAQLFVQIERELGLTFPLAALYAAPTPRKLARMLSGRMARVADPEGWQSIAPVNASGNC